jgi:hypothetical protein
MKAKRIGFVAEMLAIGSLMIAVAPAQAADDALVCRPYGDRGVEVAVDLPAALDHGLFGTRQVERYVEEFVDVRPAHGELLAAASEAIPDAAPVRHVIAVESEPVSLFAWARENPGKATAILGAIAGAGYLLYEEGRDDEGGGSKAAAPQQTSPTSADTVVQITGDGNTVTVDRSEESTETAEATP